MRPVGDDFRRQQRSQLRLGETRPFSVPPLPPRQEEVVAPARPTLRAIGGQTVGSLLRSRRESLGQEIPAVVAATRLPRRSLLALEADDFDSIAGAFYVRGFLKVYASHLGLEHEQVLERYENQVAVVPVYEEEAVAEVPNYFRSKRGAVRSLSPAQLFLLFVTAATLVVFMLSINRQRVQDQVASRPGVTAPDTPATATIGVDSGAARGADAGPN